jgi:hypothetical protein
MFAWRGARTRVNHEQEAGRMTSDAMTMKLGWLAGVACLSWGCAQGAIGGPLPDGAVELDALPGDTVAIDGARVLAPEVDQGVWAEVLYDDGTTHTLRIETLLDGRVVYFPQLADEHGDDGVESNEGSAPLASNTALKPCKDSAYTLLPWRWDERYDWQFNAGSTPKGVSRDRAEIRFKRAATNITRSDNSCGMADEVSSTHRYLGRTTRKAQIGANGSCNSGNGHNTVAFGDLPAGTAGVACVWYSAGAAVEADVKLNKAEHKWIAALSSSCSNRLSIEAVATHELGHVFGLGHVGEGAHGNLTMSTAINAFCSNAEASLGRGDVLGLRAKY